MNPKPAETEKILEKDLETVERLPAEIRELQVLMDKAAKTTGEENAVIQMEIKEKSG